MNMVTDQAALAAGQVVYLSRRQVIRPRPAPPPPRARLDLGAIIQEVLTVAACAGLLWFQIEIVRCVW